MTQSTERIKPRFGLMINNIYTCLLKLLSTKFPSCLYWHYMRIYNQNDYFQRSIFSLRQGISHWCRSFRKFVFERPRRENLREILAAWVAIVEPSGFTIVPWEVTRNLEEWSHPSAFRPQRSSAAASSRSKWSLITQGAIVLLLSVREINSTGSRCA